MSENPPNPTGEEGRQGPAEELLSRPEVTERERWTEILSAVLMSAAVVGSAFSAWQAALWGGVQSTRWAEASNTRVQSNREMSIALTQLTYDAGTFVDAAVVYSQDNEQALEIFNARLFRQEFKVAVDAWLALDPLNNPDAPATPFDVSEYSNAHETESLLLQEKAEQKFDQGRQAIKNSEDYVLATVFFASVLFFSGISTQFKGPTARLVGLVIAAIALLGGVAFVATLPHLT